MPRGLGGACCFAAAALIGASALVAARAGLAPRAERTTVVRAAVEPLAIVVNRANLLDSLSLAELRRVFRGERSRWPNGRRVTVVMRDPGAPERDAILDEVYRMSEQDYRRHFLQAVFAGEVADPPRQLSTATGVLRFVFNVPGAIGYVRIAEVDSTVRVLRVDGRLPGDPGYTLHVSIP